jgi:hypothetical protein
MAIAPDILVALKIGEEGDPNPVIKLANTNPRFPKREIEIDTSTPEEPVHIDAKTLGTCPSDLSFFTAIPSLWIVTWCCGERCSDLCKLTSRRLI